MLRQREEQVKLGSPLDLDPGDAVVVNHCLDDVVILQSPLRGDLCLLLFLSGRSRDGVGGLGHGCSPCVVGRYSHSINAYLAVGCCCYPQPSGLTVIRELPAGGSQKEC